MKKFLSIVMVLMMVFAFSASAFAVDYSDVDSLAQEVQDSIAKVSALAIFEGDGDNTFRPNDTITRAEFAKVACVAAGLGTSGDALKNTASQFTDVQPGEWWTGWINLAVAQGYMKGDPNGTFRPKDPITMAEVTTVLLRMLGYTDNLPGLWPVDYIAQAGKLDLFDNVDFKSDAPATRAQVAVLLDNDLDQNLVVWSKDKDAFEDKDPVVTLMGDSFRGTTAENVRFDGASLVYKTVDDKLVLDSASSIDSMVDAYKYTGTNKDQLELVYATANGAPSKVADDYAISGGLTLADLAGQEADIIYDLKTDGSKNEVKYIEVTSKVVTTDSIKEYSVTKNADDAEKNPGQITKGTVRINNTKYNIAAGAYIPKDMSDSSMRIVIDEDDNVIEAVFVADYLSTPAQLVDKYNESSKRIEYKVGASTKLSGKDYIFYKDGVKAEITELDENDTVYVFENACNLDYVIYATAPVTGKVTSVDDDAANKDDKIYIDGTKYSVPADGFTYSKDSEDYISGGGAQNVIEDDMFGETAQYALGRDNKVSVLVFNAEEKASNYSVITSISASSQGRVTSITIYNAEGKYVSYDLDNSDGTVATFEVGGDKDIKEGQLVKLTINSDGMVDKIDKADVEVDSTTSWQIDKTNKRVKINDTWYKVPSNVAAYDIAFDTDEDLNDYKFIDTVDTVAYNDLLAKNTFSGSALYAFTKDGQVKALAAVDYKGTTSSKFGVVKNNKYYTGSDKMFVFYGFGSDDFSYKAGNAVAANKDLISYATSGSTLENVEVLFTPSATNAANAATLNLKDLTVDGGKVWAFFGNAVAEESTSVDAQGFNQYTDGSEVLGISNDQIEVKVLKTAAEGDKPAVYESAFITLDADTEIYDFSAFTDSLASDTPEKLSADELTTGMDVIVVTSNDKDKDGYESIAMLVIVVNNR